MFNNLTRRRRQLLIVTILSSVFILSLIALFWIKSSSGEKYVPGEKISGLTSDLARNLPEDYPRVTFTNISEDAGLIFNHYRGKRTIQLPEDMGSGAAWGDYNNDGWLDLFVVNFSGPLSMDPVELSNSTAVSSLYHNNGDGSFTDVASKAGLDLAIWGNAAAWGDF